MRVIVNPLPAPQILLTMAAPLCRSSGAFPSMPRVALLTAAAVATALLVAVTPAVAQKGAQFLKAPENTDLRVFASAQVKAPFDTAIIRIDLTIQRPTLQATIASSRFAMATIRRNAAAVSIPTRDITTRDVGLRPSFNYSETPRKLLYWTINQQVRITTDKVGRVQGLLRNIASSVGRNVQLKVNSRREVGSTDALVLRALREATLAVRKKANRIAKSTGKQVKRVLYLGGNKGNWPRQYSTRGLYTVACHINGKFLLVTPGQKVADDDAEERLEDIVRVNNEEEEADIDVDAGLAELAARPDAHMEVSGTTEGEAPELYGSNPAEREFDTVLELNSMEEALEGVF